MKSTVIGSIGLALFLISCAAAEPTTALNPARSGDTAGGQSGGSVNQVGTGDAAQAGGQQTGGTTGGTAGGQAKSPATGTTGGTTVDAAFSAAAKKCTSCHTGSGASGGFQLSSTDPQDWINKKAKILGRVNDSEKPMPPGGLSDADKTAFVQLVQNLQPK